MADIYVLYGEAHSGKSSTIKEVYRILSLKYPNHIDATSILKPEEYDIKVEMSDDNGFVRDIKRIGIASHGDINETIEEYLNDFTNHKCDIIFCAKRMSNKKRNIILQANSTLKHISRKNCDIIFCEEKASNPQSVNSILKNTVVSKWNSNSQNSQHKVIHCFPKRNTGNNKQALENHEIAKEMIHQAGL